MRECYEPPDEREPEPGEDEGERECQQRPAPLRVHQRGEHVLQEAHAPLRDLRLEDVALAILEDSSSSGAACYSVAVGSASGIHNINTVTDGVSLTIFLQEKNLNMTISG